MHHTASHSLTSHLPWNVQEQNLQLRQNQFNKRNKVNYFDLKTGIFIQRFNSQLKIFKAYEMLI